MADAQRALTSPDLISRGRNLAELELGLAAFPWNVARANEMRILCHVIFNPMKCVVTS